MKLKILAVGQKMPAWVTSGYQEYAKRMPRECSLELVELAPGKRTKQSHLAKVVEGLFGQASSLLLIFVMPVWYQQALRRRK